MMAHIVENTEQHYDYVGYIKRAKVHRMKNPTSALGYATVTTANNLNAKCIITPSISGATARVVSKFKPKMDIIGVSPNEASLRRMQIYWGVETLKSFQMDTTDDICNGAIDLAAAKQYVESGDTVILTAGIPSPTLGSDFAGVTNMMKIAVVE